MGEEFKYPCKIYREFYIRAQLRSFGALRLDSWNSFDGEETYLVHVVQRVIGHLVAVETRVVSALPGNEDRERLDVLNREFQDQRGGTELVRIEIEEDQALQFRRLLAF